MACCLCRPSGGGCCCGGCGLDEGELLRQQQRQKLLETVRKMKGLSRNSRAHLPLDPLAVIEDARARMQAKEAYICCFSTPRSCTWPLLLWLCIYGAALSSLQLKLIDLRPVVPLWVLESDTLNEFSRFFSWAVVLMMGIMSAAFMVAALRVCTFISSMMTEVVIAAQEELRLDISESVDHDFYVFVRRLREHFVASEDFTVAAIKRAHRRLHSLLKARIGLVEISVQGPFAVGRDVETAIAPIRCCMLFFLFFIPWVFIISLSLAQLYLVSNRPIAGPPDPLAPPEEDAALPFDRDAALNDEGFTLIVANLLINLLAIAYLACVQTRCIEDCFASCLYSRVHAAVIEFCNRLVTRTWEEAVVYELVELLEGPRMGFERQSEEGLDNPIGSGGDDEHYLHPLTASAAFDPPSSYDHHHDQQQQQQQQRLLTGDSCGGLPTAYQAALQAPSIPPRSKSRSQCLALAPSSLWWHDVEGGTRGFSALDEGEGCLELEALHDLRPFDDEKVKSCEEVPEEGGGTHTIDMQTPSIATAAAPATTAPARTATATARTAGEGEARGEVLDVSDGSPVIEPPNDLEESNEGQSNISESSS